jgi:hypothetical protein
MNDLISTSRYIYTMYLQNIFILLFLCLFYGREKAMDCVMYVRQCSYSSQYMRKMWDVREKGEAEWYLKSPQELKAGHTVRYKMKWQKIQALHFDSSAFLRNFLRNCNSGKSVKSLMELTIALREREMRNYVRQLATFFHLFLSATLHYVKHQFHSPFYFNCLKDFLVDFKIKILHPK